MRAHALEQLESFAPGGRVARVVQIHQQQVVGLSHDAIEYATDGAHEIRLEAGIRQQQAKRLENVSLIVGDKDARGGHQQEDQDLGFRFAITAPETTSRSSSDVPD